jgi:tape measure domain-containing protein
MSDRLTWVFEMQDRMSGPARKIDQAVGQVDRQMRSVDKATQAAESGTSRVASSFSRLTMAALPTVVALGRMASAISAIITVGKMLGIGSGAWSQAFFAARNGATRAAAAMRRFAAQGIAALRRIPPHVYAIAGAMIPVTLAARVAGRALSSAFSFVRNMASTASMAAGFIAFGAAIKGATEAIDAMVSRERNLRALTIIGGSAAEGLRLRERFTDMSDFLGIDPSDVANGMQELLTKGFSEAEAVRIFQGTADIAAISPSADVGRITLAMSQIRQAGFLQGDELNQLAESGLPLVHVYERIGEAMGVAASEVRGLRGTVPAAIAIQAILDGIQDTTGQQLGAVARAASLGLGGQIDRLKQAPERLFAALADQSSAAGQRLSGLIERLNEFLNPNSASGQRILMGMVSALDMAVTAIEFIAAGIASVDPSTLRNLWLGIQVIGGSILATIAVVGMLGGAIVDSIGRAVEPFTNLEEKWASLKTELSSLATWFQTVGAQTMDGFIMGFTGGVTRALMMVQMFGAQAAGALRSALGIHSPSRVFMEMGAMSGEGFALGLSGSMPDASYDYGGVAPATAAGASDLGARSFSVHIENITIQAADGASGAQMAEDFRAKLTEVFEGLAIEQGMA